MVEIWREVSVGSSRKRAPSPTATTARQIGEGVGVMLGVLVGVKVLVGVGVLVKVLVGVGVLVCVGVRVAVGVQEGVQVGDGVIVQVGVLVTVAVSVADCVPVLIFDPEKRAAAAAHAGRLGTMSDIAGKTVAAMQAQFGSDPAHLLAEIGPSAGPNQYEVSEEIAAEFEQLGLPKQGRLLDLWGANRLQLESAGLLPDLIRVTGQCTIGDSRYYSHRRQKTLERNLAVVMI